VSKNPGRHSRGCDTDEHCHTGRGQSGRPNTRWLSACACVSPKRSCVALSIGSRLSTSWTVHNSQEAAANQGAGQVQQPLEQIRPSLVAHAEATAAQQPGKCPLHDPTVPAQPLGGIDPASCKPWHDASGTQGTPQIGRVVGLVGMEFRRTLPGPAWSSARAEDGWNGVEQRDELGRVVDVSARKTHC
jgi:hypothetical protein